MRTIKVNKQLKRIMVFVICLIVGFSTTVGFGEYKYLVDKHFLQFGIDKVEATYNGEPTYIANMGGVNYVFQKFLSSGTFIVPPHIYDVDVTVVGGGGAGSSTAYWGEAGGGGGGGYVENYMSLSDLPGSSVPVVVGAGGHYVLGSNGTSGEASSYKSSTYIANGGAGGIFQGAGGNGGSGGGGYGYGTSGGAGGSDGENGESKSGDGGIGQWASTEGVDGVLYGGGGGGGSESNVGGLGGAVGGGNGGSGEDATSGMPNTGGGGGGTGGRDYVAGGNGGSGIVVIRWRESYKPTISVTSPAPNSAYSEVAGYNTISLAGTVSDPNTGNHITTKYNIDGGTEQTVDDIVITCGSFTTTNINASSLSQGNHTLNVWAVDDSLEISEIVQIPFKVDKSVPILGTVTVTSTTSDITIAGSATDSIAGLDPYPYRYTVSTKTATSWLTAASYTQGYLTPNTIYYAKFEARDAKGHIASNEQGIFTEAEVPTVTVNNPTSYTLNVSLSDTNPLETAYMVIADSNKYVTPEGTLTTSPVWITPADKKITVTGLNPETLYTFQVKARNGSEVETQLSSSVSGTTLIAPPGSPADIIATASDSIIGIAWDAVPTAAGYEVEADGSIVDAGTSTTYTHTGLAPGTPHTYRVRGINEGGSGNWSTAIEKSTLPSAPNVPANLTAIPLSTSVTVTWDNVPGATGYDIEVDGVLVNNGPNTNYKHTSLTPGTSHTYRVRSINAGDKSGWSSPVTVMTLVESTPVPVNITPVPAKNQITVTWDAVDGSTGYEIEVDGVRLDNNTSTSYTHNSLEPDTDHIYRVRAKRNGTLSDWSAMVVATTLEDGFGIPSSFKAYAEDTKVSLSWDTVTDAVYYDVEIDGNIVSNGIDNFCMHEGLLPDTTHSYRVKAGNGTETSGWSNMLTVTTFTLPTPKNITATATETSIQTVWEEVYGAASYELDFDGTIISDISTASYNCDGLNPGTQHSLSVRAKNDNSTSNWSIPVKESTINSGLNTVGISGMARKNSITLLWNQVDSAQTYDLEIDGAVVEDVSGTTYLHSNLSPGTQHTYRVRTRDGSDIGEWSSMFTAATLAETPAIPTNVAASSTMTSILVTWDKVTAAESYEIEVDGVVVDNGTGTSYLHSSLSPDTTHTYRVRGRNLGGYSEWSELISKATVNSVQTYNIDCIMGDEFNLILSAANIQDMGNYSFTVRYNVEDFDVTDLCGLTPRIDASTGSITGTDIKIMQYEPGTIVFTKTSSAQSYEVWSGIVNSIKFKAKHDGQMVITYSIN